MLDSIYEFASDRVSSNTVSAVMLKTGKLKNAVKLFEGECVLRSVTNFAGAAGSLQNFDGQSLPVSLSPESELHARVSCIMLRIHRCHETPRMVIDETKVPILYPDCMHEFPA